VPGMNPHPTRERHCSASALHFVDNVTRPTEIQKPLNTARDQLKFMKLYPIIFFWLEFLKRVMGVMWLYRGRVLLTHWSGKEIG
jgi:hypothetical protein